MKLLLRTKFNIANTLGYCIGIFGNSEAWDTLGNSSVHRCEPRYAKALLGNGNFGMTRGDQEEESSYSQTSNYDRGLRNTVAIARREKRRTNDDWLE